jgi:hypothetical protein
MEIPSNSIEQSMNAALGRAAYRAYLEKQKARQKTKQETKQETKQDTIATLLENERILKRKIEALSRELEDKIYAEKIQKELIEKEREEIEKDKDFAEKLLIEELLEEENHRKNESKSNNRLMRPSRILTDRADDELDYTPFSNELPNYKPRVNTPPCVKAENTKVCCICRVNNADWAIVPCGHMVHCSECLARINQCSICRGSIVSKIRIFS